MTHKLSFHNTVMDIDIEHDADGVLIDNDSIAGLVRALRAMHSVVPLASFKLTQQGMTQDYDYRIDTANGRRWEQVITFDSANDPLMTFDVPDQWRLSEFATHRQVRDSCVLLVNEVGLTKVTVTWL